MRDKAFRRKQYIKQKNRAKNILLNIFGYDKVDDKTLAKFKDMSVWWCNCDYCNNVFFFKQKRNLKTVKDFELEIKEDGYDYIL